MDWAIKYRPQTLNEVIGQESNIKRLKSNLKDPCQTMIFYGTSGCGKTSTARAFANDINAYPIEINGANNNTVKDARDIYEMAVRCTLFNDYKAFIIDECQRLSREAWDVLLKVTEEPIKSTIFILCTTEYKTLPPTIKGRSQLFQFNSIEPTKLLKLLESILQKENATLPLDVLKAIAQYSKYQARDSIKLLQRCIDENIKTVVGLNETLVIPRVEEVAAFITAVLTSEQRQAVRLVKQMDGDLSKWARRMETLIYEILFNRFEIEPLEYSVNLTKQLVELGSTTPPQTFGRLLDKLHAIQKQDEAFAKLFILSLNGVGQYYSPHPLT